MPPMNIDDRIIKPGPRIALFDLGFRPFFLFGAIAAVLLIGAWLYWYAGGPLAAGYYDPVAWHSHEMVFGYAAAVIAGFLLTAVRNWTGMPTPAGIALAGLVILWLAGRVGPFFSGEWPPLVIAALDMAFLPVLVVTLSVPLVRSRQNHNLVLLLVPALLAVANLMIHLEVLGLTQRTAQPGIYFSIHLIVLLIAVLGGRVIPFFTERGIAGAKTRQWKTVEYLSLGSLVVLTVFYLVEARQPAIVVAALLAMIGHGIRLYGWHHKNLWSVPLLWVLHLGYAWLVAGLALTALSAAGLVNPAAAIHAFTAGSIGVMTLGMMARVALGHTGRPLQVNTAMSWAFVLLNLAAICRVLLPLLAPGVYKLWINMAGALWSTAFVIFVVVYAGILIRPRIDGRPG